jgi:hypothetical protein
MTAPLLFEGNLGMLNCQRDQGSVPLIPGNAERKEKTLIYLFLSKILSIFAVD